MAITRLSLHRVRRGDNRVITSVSERCQCIDQSLQSVVVELSTQAARDLVDVDCRIPVGLVRRWSGRRQVVRGLVRRVSAGRSSALPRRRLTTQRL
ncbi:hypothetical protein Ae356Ps1_6295 [Pseudonocardia sp. Ae356_Ps1]|nr:hypothetical protein Ae356Ps1_6295 [Pseudonocardia sp. Ae356_Ps1]